MVHARAAAGQDGHRPLPYRVRALVYQHADDFDLALPIAPALHVEPAYTGGTAITTGEGGYYSTPPDAPIDPQIRATIQLDS